MNRMLAGIISFLSISTEHISFLMHERQQELQKLTHYTDSWSTTQLVSQYYRFGSLLGLYTIDDMMNLNNVRMCLDIMLSQSDLIKEGDPGCYVKSNVVHRELAVRLENILSLLDINLEKVNRLALQVYLRKMHTLDASLGRLSPGMLNKDVNLVNNASQKIQTLYYIYSAASVLPIILNAILGVFVSYQSKNILQAYLQVKSLAEELQKSKGKLQMQNVRLEYDVYRGSLAEMNNRQLFWNDLNKTIEKVKKNHDSMTVMLFDLDRFKEINDTYGHGTGDMLLRQIFDRLVSMNLTLDTLYCLGGNEFAFLSSGLTESHAVSYVQKIREFTNQPYTIYNMVVNITTCAGIVISNTERHPDYLYKFADLALYKARGEGSGKIKVLR